MGARIFHGEAFEPVSGPPFTARLVVAYCRAGPALTYVHSPSHTCRSDRRIDSKLRFDARAQFARPYHQSRGPLRVHWIEWGREDDNVADPGYVPHAFGWAGSRPWPRCRSRSR